MNAIAGKIKIFSVFFVAIALALFLTAPAFAQFDGALPGGTAATDAAMAAANGTKTEAWADVISLETVGKAFTNVFPDNIIGTLAANAQTKASGLRGLALSLTGALLLAYGLWAILLAMKDGKPVIDEVVERLIYGALIVFLINSYTIIVNDVLLLGNALIAKTGTTFGQAIAAYIVTFVGTGIKLIIKALMGVFSLNIITSAASLLILLMFAGIALKMLLDSLIEVFTIALTGPVYFAVAVTLGPLFIATMASPWTIRWFDQWINFVINAGTLTALLVIVLVTITTFFSSIFQAAASADAAGNGLAMAGQVIQYVALTAIAGKIIAQVPAMADGLLPGRTGAGGASKGAGASGAKALTSAAGTLKSQAGAGVSKAKEVVAARAAAGLKKAAEASIGLRGV